MTIRHLLEGAMQWTGTRCCYHFALLTGLDKATVSRMANADSYSMRIETLDQIQRTTGAPIEMLMMRYRLPEGVALGRVREAA